MNSKLDEALTKDFPLLYSNRHRPISESNMAFGFECDDGWEPLIRKLSEKLENLIKPYINGKQKNDPNHKYFEEHPKATQVKEKYGELCFYMNYASEDMWKLIETAEKSSLSICECCGKPGKPGKVNNWVKTLCTECEKQRAQ